MAKKFDKWRYEILEQLIRDNGYVNFVEIGVAKGTTSKYLHDRIDNLSIYCVDPYELYDSLHRRAKRKSKERYEDNYAIAKDTLFNLPRVQHYRMHSVDAAKEFPDNSIDIVFVDGNHTYKAVMQDLKAWYPKLVSGGCMAGHDYYGNKGHHYHCVAKAVDKFCKDNDLELHLDDNYTFYFFKP